MLDVEKNSFQTIVLQYVFGEDTQDGHAALGEPCRPTLVASELGIDIMHRSIHFDRQPRGRTIKIQNVRSDRMLSAKAQAGQPSLP